MSVPYEQLPADLQARVRALDPDARPTPKDRSHRRELPGDDGNTYTCRECDRTFTRYGGKNGAETHVISEHGGGRITCTPTPKADSE